MKVSYLVVKDIFSIPETQEVKKYSPSLFMVVSAHIYLGLTQILFMALGGIFSIHSNPVSWVQVSS